ncbi:MAG: glycosyltransferase family 2 protein [Clostridia bacterium]|nr:glycosyltransferase family 2 protein [Clostridia bacterium]
METVEYIKGIVLAVLGVLMFYKGIYTALGFFSKAKVFPKAAKDRKYGIVVAARNEEKVIGHLVDSLMSQTYPCENYKVFVVADNCSDKTAEIAREHGAIVYERHCPEKARKGWALECLFESIEKDYGIKSFDGYLFFDADNVVASDYLEQMNNAFATGCDAVIGYRNTKNFDRNCISAHYGIHFMRSTMTLHRPRGRLGLSTHIAGTGYLLSSDLLKDGWHYAYLTEDTQATMDFTVQGKRVEYCEAAEFYDEQPYQLKVMARQRIRWAKGRMACFFSFGHCLVFGVFKRFKTPKTNIAPEPKAEAKGFWDKVLNVGTAVGNFFGRVLRPIAKNFSCYDMIFYLLPKSMLTLIYNVAYYLASFILGFSLGQIAVGDVSKWVLLGLGMLFGSVFAYAGNIAKGLLVVIREWKHINCAKHKFILILLTWPLYDMIYAYLCVASLFMHVKWKPIKHDEAISIEDIKTKKETTDN